MSERTMRIGLVGFGVGGRHFHGPFIEAASGVELAGVVARRDETKAAVAERFPGTPTYDSLAELVDTERAGAGLDAVTVSTPPATRRALVLEALDSGLHVVADKPFAPDAVAAQHLSDAADRAGRILGVYHNRRLDSDFVTVSRLIASGRLGRVTRFHSRMDQGDASTMEGGPTGGLLRDLGSHLIDQGLHLFGPVERVHATLDEVDTPDGPTDGAFVVSIRHGCGTTSHLSASKLNYLDERELRIYGDAGSYLARSTDVQAQAVLAGRRPTDEPAEWGREPERAWGTLRTAAGAETIPAEQGNYAWYYERFAEAIRTGNTPPVPAHEGVAVLRVLDAIRESTATGQAVRLG
ncbi:MAG: Gfo/Idh/MocA family protein [Actinomycetales bacterium]